MKRENRDASHLVVVLYEFRALYTLISVIGVARRVCGIGNVDRTRCVLSALCGVIEAYLGVDSMSASLSGKALSLSRHLS